MKGVGIKATATRALRNTGLIVAEANKAAYEACAAKDYVDGAPHLKHAALRRLYGGLLAQVWQTAAAFSSAPRVLDLGAGQGWATVRFLQLGAYVTAIDISEKQLRNLIGRCRANARRLETRAQESMDAVESIRARGMQYDIIVANSFLHHVPDYLGLIRGCLGILAPRGQVFTFQDPLRYDSIDRWTRAFVAAAYLSWRLFRGDLAGGFLRRVRTSRGILCDGSPQDMVEYHVVRNGVDQDAICRLLRRSGMDCRVLRYFSTQSRFGQLLGEALRVRNTFACIARRQ